MIQVKQEEQYTLLLPTGTLDEAARAEMEKRVVQGMEVGHRNFIVHLENVPGSAHDITQCAKHLKRIIEKEAGMLIFSAAPPELEETLDEQGIITTLTLSEATDYVFMEEIERQLMSEESDEVTDEEE